MTAPEQELTGHQMPTLRASVVVGAGGSALPDEVSSRIMRVVVDADLHRPGMFEVTFLDYDGSSLSSAGIVIGSVLEVWSSAATDPVSRLLMVGEVTSLEGALHGMRVMTTARGYSVAHRLQRARRTRTFLNSTDAEIAAQIVLAAGLEAGEIEPTTTTYEYLAQVNQTDWEFLVHRATEIGFEAGVADGLFYFRPASTVERPASAEPAAVTFPDTLMMFCPRISAGNQPSGVEVRVWDPLAAQAIAVPGVATDGSLLASGLPGSTVTPATVGAEFTPAESALPAAVETSPSLHYLGPEPSTTAYVVNDRPVATGLAIDLAGTAVAAGVGQHLGTTFAEAEGEAVGNPAIMPGAAVEVTGVQAPFGGRWLVTHARHIFDDSEHGYRTSFSAHGTNDRSVLGLTAAGRAARPRIEGVVCGIVSNCNDPFAKGRIKAVLPWLSPTFETDWAPVVQFGTGQRTGSMFLPEVGDEVLLAFEHADPRRPYVLGGMVNNYSTWSLGGPAVQSLGLTGSVVRRGFVSSAGNALIFNDEVMPPPAVGPPAASNVRLGAAPGEFAGGELQPGAVLSLDQVAGKAALTCNPVPGVTTLPAGSVTIGATDGEITISTGPGPVGSVTVDGGSSLTLKALEITIEAEAMVEIKGPQIRLN